VRPVWSAPLAATLVAVPLALGWAWRPQLNFFAKPGTDLARLAILHLERGRPERAVELYLQALDAGEGKANWWYNLGVAYTQLGREQEADDAFEHTAELKPGSRTIRKWLAGWRARQALVSLAQEDHREAVRLFEQALELDDQDARNWYSLGFAYQRLANLDKAREAFRRAATLEPGNAGYRAAHEALGGAGQPEK
jgi:Flp pilus assembly protein TadD